MKIRINILIIIIICNHLILFSQEVISVIPKPTMVTLAGGYYDVGDLKQIAIPPKNEGCQTIARWMIPILKPAGDMPIIAASKMPSTKSVYFQLLPADDKPEAYRLKITKAGILIEASTNQGFFYGAQSLIQMIQTSTKKDSVGMALLPYCIIEDEPEFGYRGLHLDVSRHFFSVDFVKEYIDLMARFKFNYFHWHLTDDQGWRIQIKKYPNLTDVGSVRNETLIGHYSQQPQQFDKTEYGGYYKQEEIQEIVQYAKERYIEIIPEIEMPGHSSAALASYPFLGCTGGPYQVATKWGVFEDVFCTKDTTLQFIKDVLDELCALFPGKYIHVGGDECPKTRWKSCKDCQTVKRRNNIQSEEELQSYFIQQIDLHLTKKGKQLIGWDEIHEGGLSSNAIVMSWRGEEGGKKAALVKHKAIMCPSSHCYFDYYQSQNSFEPLAIGGYTSLEKTYSYTVIPHDLKPEFTKYIMGVQGNVWTEYLRNRGQVLYMAYPRALALAEVSWTKKSNQNYSDFLERLQKHAGWFADKNINITKAMLDLDYKTHPHTEGSLLVIKKPPVTGKMLVETYRNGDYEQEYLSADSFILSKDINFKTWFQLENKSLGNSLSIQFQTHKGVGAKINFLQQASPIYFLGGDYSVINGIQAPENKYGGNEWVGMEGIDFEATLDLGTIKNIDSIHIQHYHDPGSWIHKAKSSEIWTSKDGIQFEKVDIVEKNIAIKNCFENKITFAPIATRYVKIVIKNHGIIEEGVPGAGHKAWLFVGEIRIL